MDNPQKDTRKDEIIAENSNDSVVLLSRLSPVVTSIIPDSIEFEILLSIPSLERSVIGNENKLK